MRALLSSFSPPPPPSPSSSIALSRRYHLKQHTTTASSFPSHARRSCRVFRFSGGRGGGGKVWADVKSEKRHHVTESNSKFEDDDDVAVMARDLDNVAAAWWHVFPKRWVIVILCFSAFLLCNMDRVSSSASRTVFMFTACVYIKSYP